MAGKIYITIFVVMFFMQGCTTMREAKMLKKMEGKIPSSSKWLGGADGGVWVNIIMLSKNNFDIIVYNDYTGSKITELNYSYTCSVINEKLIFKALNTFANGLHWKADNPVSKCITLKEKAPN